MTGEPRVPMNPHVQSVRALDDYELEVTFDNGEQKEFDVKPYLSRGIFVRLRDRSLFEAVRTVAGSIEWPGGLDLSYDTLYIGGRSISEAAEGKQQEASKMSGQSIMDNRNLYKAYAANQSITDQADP